MTFLEVCQKYGQSIATVVVGSKVLIEGGDPSEDTHVTLCEVTSVEGSKAHLHEMEMYYLSGAIVPRSGDIDYPVSSFKDSIASRLQKQNAFLRWFDEQMRE